MLTAAGVAHGQAPAGLPITLPGAGRFLVESEISDYRPEEFVDHDGRSDAFLRPLDLIEATVRLSWSPISRLAVGVELPYRSSHMDVEGAPALTSNGSPGVRVFVDWAPVASAKLDGAIRLGWFGAAASEDRALTVRDGFDRFSAKAWLKSGPDLLPPDWRIAFGAEAQYGRSRAADGDLVDVRLDIHAARRFARVGTAGLFLRGLGGYEIATRSVAEGLTWNDLKSRRAFAGVAVDAEWQTRPAPAPHVELFAERGVWAANSLSGWRIGAAFRTGL
jgi:hypothetical protein